MLVKKKKKWTVFFIVQSVDSSRDELLSMLNEIRSLNFNNEIAIVFCITTTDQNLPALLSGDITLLVEPGPEKTSTTVFLTLEPDISKNARFPNKLVPIDQQKKFELSTPNDLTAFFRSHRLEKFRAKRYMVFTWDHGNAFGIFGKHADNKKLLPEARKLAIERQVDIMEPLNEMLQVPETDGLLTMEELAASLEAAFGEATVDVIVMLNCHMQIVDTGFALKHVAKYLVASELAIDFNGYNYPFIFQLLIDNPKISPKKLAKHIVSSFSTKIFPNDDLGDFNKSITAVSAVELFYYFNFERFVNQLSEFLIALLPEGVKIIMEAREQAIVNKGKHLVDVYTFLTFLARQQQFKNNTLLVSLAFSMREMVLFQTHIGDAFKEEKGISKYRPTGLSVFFPLAVTPEEDKRTGLQTTSFFRTTRWKDFLSTFQASLQPSVNKLTEEATVVLQ